MLPQKTKKIPLMEKPGVPEKVAKAILIANRNPRKVKNIRELVSNPQIREILSNILELSPLTTPQKSYLKSVFIDGLTTKKAIRKAFGRDLGYGEELVVEGLAKNEAVEEFIAIIKNLYIQVAPVAVLKEVEIMLSPFTPERERLKASMDIQDRAGLGNDNLGSSAKNLPVQVIINTPVQVNVQGGEENG